MGRDIVINASPLIFLARAGHSELLRGFGDRVLVPLPVARELRAKGGADPAVQILEGSKWLEVVPVASIPDAILEWALGAGESSVLALAEMSPGREAIIDDLAARRCAAVRGIPVRGTLGIVLVAKKRGLIEAARPVMEDLIRGGMYLSTDVLNEALSRVGE